jgi:hypothetical protein
MVLFEALISNVTDEAIMDYINHQDGLESDDGGQNVSSNSIVS